MRALILTNQFYHFAGAEMVALEMAEELRRRDFDVSLIANEIGGELKVRLSEIGVDLSVSPENFNPFEYDLIWSQHHILPTLFLNAIEQQVVPKNWPFLIFNHLSPYDPAEVPGPFIERLFGDLILANSPETSKKLEDYGSPFDQAKVFANPAPPEFYQEGPSSNLDLRSLLVVSNHRNPKINQTLRKIAKRGVRITRVGRRHTSERVTPALIERHDAVLTIGKTVQYALRSRRPVFCYDRFHGPGWLMQENFAEASWFNFSGRDTQKERSTDQLVGEIIDGYAEAREFVSTLDVSRMRQYSLEAQMDDLLKLSKSCRESASWHRQRVELFEDSTTRDMIRHEARLAALYKKEFLHRRGLEQRKEKFRKPLRALQNLSRRLNA